MAVSTDSFTLISDGKSWQWIWNGYSWDASVIITVLANNSFVGYVGCNTTDSFLFMALGFRIYFAYSSGHKEFYFTVDDYPVVAAILGIPEELH